MDQPDLDPREHRRALRAIGRINRWSGTAGLIGRTLKRLAREHGLQSLRVLDLATGGGDVALRLGRWGRRNGIDLRVDGCDISPTAVEEARARADALRSPARFFVLDAVGEPLPQDYDVILSCLFLHHLSQEQATDLIRRIAGAARLGGLIDDLQRGPAGHAAACLAPRFLTRSRMVHRDALISVAAAFTTEEAAAMAVAAGLQDFELRPHWPFRFMLSWCNERKEKPNGGGATALEHVTQRQAASLVAGPASR